MRKPLYDDGTYLVTATSVATPTRYYPIANATVRIRKDPLWFAFASASFVSAAAMIYGDLLHPGEVVVGAIAVLTFFVIGINVRILSLDAIGHPRAIIFGSRKKIAALFKAISKASSAEVSRFLDYSDENDSHPYQ